MPSYHIVVGQNAVEYFTEEEVRYPEFPSPSAKIKVGDNIE